MAWDTFIADILQPEAAAEEREYVKRKANEAEESQKTVSMINEDTQSFLLGNFTKVATDNATKQKDKRKKELNRMLAENEFLSPEESAKEYGMLGIKQKRICLLNSLGYLRTFKFHITQSQVLGIENIDDLGTIEVGRKKIAEMLKKASDLLNKQVGEIFKALKDLSDSLNRFFAGLDKDVSSHATTAVTSAKSISRKDILTKKTDPEQATQLGLPGIGK